MYNPFEISNLARIAYNKTADKYHECFKDEMSRKEYDRQILNKYSDLLNRNSLVCDAGCGPSGHIGKYLADKSHKVTGIDISEKCIEIAKKYNPSLHYLQMDMFDLKFKPDTFDGIISFYSILYSPKALVPLLFDNFNKVLKTGGKLLVVVKKGETEGFLDNDDWYTSRVHFTLFDESEIRKYFLDAGFNIDMMDTRKPYDFELNVDRIYGIGTKT
jgi:ubiquinone/menaquinone biosynthesis C-methylase UbiE